MTQDDMLRVCGQVPGWIQTDECVWLFEAASRLKAGQSWVNLAPWQGRSLLAAGLGLPADCRLISVGYLLELPEKLSSTIHPAEESVRNLNRLRELRPELAIDASAGDLPDASDQIDDATINVVFIDGCRDYESVSRQIEAWRPKIAAGGRLAGHGYGRSDGLGVTRAVALGDGHNLDVDAPGSDCGKRRVAPIVCDCHDDWPGNAPGDARKHQIAAAD
jgi:hypothetical protein